VTLNRMNNEQTIDDYLTAYGETDTVRRRALIQSCFTPDATLADPPAAATGHDELDGMFGAVQQQFPGHHFERTSGIDEHHGTARYTWSLIAADGTVTVAGLDIVHFAADGRLDNVVGFFGDVPPR
jgi:hypothetical protein